MVLAPSRVWLARNALEAHLVIAHGDKLVVVGDSDPEWHETITWLCGGCAAAERTGFNPPPSFAGANLVAVLESRPAPERVLTLVRRLRGAGSSIPVFALGTRWNTATLLILLL